MLFLFALLIVCGFGVNEAGASFGDTGQQSSQLGAVAKGLPPATEQYDREPNLPPSQSKFNPNASSGLPYAPGLTSGKDWKDSWPSPKQRPTRVENKEPGLPPAK